MSVKHVPGLFRHKTIQENGLWISYARWRVSRFLDPHTYATETHKGRELVSTMYPVCTGHLPPPRPPSHRGHAPCVRKGRACGIPVWGPGHYSKQSQALALPYKTTKRFGPGFPQGPCPTAGVRRGRRAPYRSKRPPKAWEATLGERTWALVRTIRFPSNKKKRKGYRSLSSSHFIYPIGESNFAEGSWNPNRI